MLSTSGSDTVPVSYTHLVVDDFMVIQNGFGDIQPQSCLLYTSECVCRKIERKEILRTAVDALGDCRYVCHNRHHFILLPIQIYHIPNGIGRLRFFLAVLRAGGSLHHHIAPGQEFIFIKGAIQYPAILCKGVQYQAVNAVQNGNTLAALNHIMVGFGQPRVRCFNVRQPVVSAVSYTHLDVYKRQMQGAVGGSIEQVKEIFLTVFLFAHGYASIIANNSLEYDEELIKSHLERAYRGAILATQEETK